MVGSHHALGKVGTYSLSLESSQVGGETPGSPEPVPGMQGIWKSAHPAPRREGGTERLESQRQLGEEGRVVTQRLGDQDTRLGPCSVAHLPSWADCGQV